MNKPGQNGALLHVCLAGCKREHDPFYLRQPAKLTENNYYELE